jgi:hypothetical protein
MYLNAGSILLQFQAVAIPLLLTSLVYAGSFVTRLWFLASSWGSGDEVEIGCAQRLAQWIQAAVADVMVWRNYVVVCSSSPFYHFFFVLIRYYML